MASELGHFTLFLFLGLASILSLSVLFSLIKQGPSAIADLSRKGVGMRNWANGDLPDQRDGTSINVIEGIEILADGEKLLIVKQKRGFSTEV